MPIKVGDKVKIKLKHAVKYPFKDIVGEVNFIDRKEKKLPPIRTEFIDKNNKTHYIYFRDEELEKVDEEEEDIDEHVVEMTCPDCASELETKCTKCRKKYTFSVLFTEVKK